MPTFFALSASRDGYVPQSKNVAAALVQGATLDLDFELEPETRRVVAIEAVPDVHHLGDNDFDGRINSQFQKRAEGASFAAIFELSPGQLPRGDDAVTLVMLVKGAQLRSRIRINGRVIPQRLDWSPNDGSFGEFTAALSPGWLKVGVNTVEILASSQGSDIDDFEFVNVQIHFGS